MVRSPAAKRDASANPNPPALQLALSYLIELPDTGNRVYNAKLPAGPNRPSSDENINIRDQTRPDICLPFDSIWIDGGAEYLDTDLPDR